jgi:ribosomal protein S18 acetylase RimI-like enzyme
MQGLGMEGKHAVDRVISNAVMRLALRTSRRARNGLQALRRRCLERRTEAAVDALDDAALKDLGPSWGANRSSPGTESMACYEDDMARTDVGRATTARTGADQPVAFVLGSGCCGAQRRASTADLADAEVDAIRHGLPQAHPAAISWFLASPLDSFMDAVHLRQLDRGDIPEIERHFLALDSLGRRNRFGSTLSDFAVSTYAQRIDPSREIVIGAVDGRSNRIVGLAQAAGSAANRRVDLAVSVQTAYRRRGLGRGLVTMATAIAVECGAEAAEFRFAAGNRAISGLVRTLGTRADLTLDGTEVRGIARLSQSVG